MVMRSVALLSFVVALPGCAAASSPYMHEVKTPPPQARAADATVIFVHPSGYASAMVTTILDGLGHYLGDSPAESYFAVTLPPGEHLFISWAENTSALRATLAAGRMYFVEVSPKMGVVSARVHLLAVLPNGQNWGKLRGWVTDSKHLEPDLEAGQRYLNRRHADVVERIRRANETMQGYTAEERADRTLRAEDGVR